MGLELFQCQIEKIVPTNFFSRNTLARKVSQKNYNVLKLQMFVGVSSQRHTLKSNVQVNGCINWNFKGAFE